MRRSSLGWSHSRSQPADGVRELEMGLQAAGARRRPQRENAAESVIIPV